MSRCLLLAACGFLFRLFFHYKFPLRPEETGHLTICCMSDSSSGRSDGSVGRYFDGFCSGSIVLTPSRVCLEALLIKVQRVFPPRLVWTQGVLSFPERSKRPSGTRSRIFLGVWFFLVAVLPVVSRPRSQFSPSFPRQFPDARCLDGSMAGFYVRKGWFFWVEGAM